MFLRFLAICVQAGDHPLKHPVIAQMVPHIVDTVQYVRERPAVLGWTFKAHIIGPIEVLQTLGVDVFADLRYDTWVLMTMW